MKGVTVITALVAAVLLFLHISSLPAPAQEYVLGEGDLVKITIYENDDLTTQTRIPSDGVINFPLVGSVKVGGVTVSDAEKKLSELLSQGYLVNPHVTLFVVEYRSQKVTILGEVRKPGLYELNGNVTLLELISKAEGLTENAGDKIIIKRKTSDSGNEGDTISTSLKALREKGDPKANIPIEDGDSIFITKGGFVYVTGEVKKPGAYKFEEGATVMKAIALAEGLTDKAAPGRTKVIRVVDGKETTLKVDMGFLVKPDDVVSVPESFF